VIEDVRSGLEHVGQSYIKKLVAEGYLRADGYFWWITRKAAERFNLRRVMGCEFPA
jgi:hypothetical protein